jgi:O-antigen/teichoic acid export membrane protein
MKESIETNFIPKAWQIRFFVDGLFKNKLTRQTAILFSSQILLIVIGVFTGVINSRYLGPEGYGIYSFVMAIISFISIFLGFGFTSAGARLVAVAPNKENEREIVGSLLIIAICLALIFSLVVFLSGLFIDKIFGTRINEIIMLISIISGALPLQLIIIELLRGANRINERAFSDVIPKVWYLGMAIIAVAFFELTPISALFMNLGGILIVCLIMFKRLKPLFSNMKANLRLLWKETKEYGVHVYLGGIADTGTRRLDNMFIAGFVNTTSVGFYTLANTIVSPILKLPEAMSISLFKDLTRINRIPNIIIYFNVIWLTLCITILIIAGKFLIIALFGEKFLRVLPLVFPLAIAGFFQGMYAPLHMFLSAHRRGKELRFISFVEGGFNLVGNFAFIYYWGAMGAAIAIAIGKGIELFLNWYFYRKCIKVKCAN